LSGAIFGFGTVAVTLLGFALFGSRLYPAA